MYEKSGFSHKKRKKLASKECVLEIKKFIHLMGYPYIKNSCKAVGVSYPTMWHWERGYYVPGLKYILKMREISNGKIFNNWFPCKLGEMPDFRKDESFQEFIIRSHVYSHAFAMNESPQSWMNENFSPAMRAIFSREMCELTEADIEILQRNIINTSTNYWLLVNEEIKLRKAEERC